MTFAQRGEQSYRSSEGGHFRKEKKSSFYQLQSQKMMQDIDRRAKEVRFEILRLPSAFLV